MLDDDSQSFLNMFEFHHHHLHYQRYWIFNSFHDYGRPSIQTLSLSQWFLKYRFSNESGISGFHEELQHPASMFIVVDARAYAGAAPI